VDLVNESTSSVTVTLQPAGQFELLLHLGPAPALVQSEPAEGGVRTRQLPFGTSVISSESFLTFGMA
jgi:hypothetical protein